MNYRDLLNSGENVSVTIKLEDLREVFKEILGSLKLYPKSNTATEEFLSRKEVLNILKIDSSNYGIGRRLAISSLFPLVVENVTSGQM